MSPSYPRKTGFAQASLISLDIADTLSDTLFRGHSRFSADGIALPTPRLDAKQSSTDTVELTLVELKNRHGIGLYLSAERPAARTTIAAVARQRGSRDE
jgi:hypothetical protein